MKTVEELLAALQAIVDGAEGRSLTDDEVTSYEALEVELRNVQKDVEIRSRQTAYNTPVNAGVAVNVNIPKEDDTLERAFDHYLRTGRENADIVELRAQSKGTTTEGGFTVPQSLRQKMQERLKAFGGLATAVEEITTSGGEKLTWPTLDDTANSGVIAAEGAGGAGGADLVFGEKQLGAFKYVAPGAGALPLRVSLELLQDSAFDIQGLVTRKLAERIYRKQAVDWVSGGGTTLPFGINTGTNGTTFTSAGITYAELVTAVHDVDPAYRQNAKWCFNDATMAFIEKVVDTTGRPILSPSTDGISSGPNNRSLLGYPVVIDQAWPTYTGTGGGAIKFGVFGDLNAGYVIRRVKDVTLIVNPYARANEGQVEYTLWARADGVTQDINAYRVLNDAA